MLMNFRAKTGEQLIIFIFHVPCHLKALKTIKINIIKDKLEVRILSYSEYKSSHTEMSRLLY